MRLRARFEDVLFGPESGARLLVAHVALSALLFVRIAFAPYRQLAGLDDALFDPVPVLGWLPAMPGELLIAAIQVVGAVAALAAALRRHPRVAFGIAWVCYLVLAGLRGSRGKVLHNDLLLLWASVPFLFAPVEVGWRDRERRRRFGWPVRSAMAIAAFVYFLAGYHKLRRSGVDWAIGDNVRYVMLWGPTIGRAAWDSMAEWVADHAWAYKATGVVILGFELTMPVALLRRGLQPLYAALAVALHAATYLFLGLDYWAWGLTVLVLFVDWPDLTDRLQRWRPSHGRVVEPR